MTNRIKRQRRIRSKVKGAEGSPRLSVFRSNKYIYVQAVNDKTGRTLVSVSEKEVKVGKTKSEKAKIAGVLLASKLKKKKIEKIVFDRGGYKYHGRVKALAQGLREGGIKF